MLNIKPQQHSKILGFALIAYGLQFVFKAFEITRLFWGENLLSDDAPFYYYFFLLFDSLFTPFWYFIFAILSGILIIFSKRKDKLFGLSFVFLNLYIFPLGTILSFYTLWYLFAVDTNKIETD